MVSACRREGRMNQNAVKGSITHSRVSRRITAIVGALALVFTISSSVGASPVKQPVRNDGLEVHVRPYIELPDASSGLPPRINSFASVGGDLYVGVQTDGLIYRVSGSYDNPKTSVWFDVRTAIELSTDQVLDNTNNAHGGLRSIAFHPGFLTNGLFYTSVMERRPDSTGGHRYISDVATPIAADSVLIEWRIDLTTMKPISTSYREVFRVGMPVYDHPIKGIAFDPFASPGDENYGLLYVGHGDGSVLSALAGGGQNNDALGKILRIDPTVHGGSPYRISPSNPFVNDPSMPGEVFSFGHRNPHNLAFVRYNGTSVLLVAEAGRDNVEEINIIKGGDDYGWPQREGTFVHLAAGGEDVGVTPLPLNDAQNGFTYPAAQLGHTGAPNEAIAGGYAIDNNSDLDGHYFYSDFPISGKLYHSSVEELVGATTKLDPADPSRDSPTDLSQATIRLATIRFDHDANETTRSTW